MNPSENSNSINRETEINQLKDDHSTKGEQNNQQILEEDKYVFGWGKYSETTNGRFAMIGFAAIILIEMVSKKSFLEWAGIIN